MMVDTEYRDYIFIIYSHKANLDKANKLLERYLVSFVSNLKIKVFIMYGDKTEFNASSKRKPSADYIIRDKYLILNTADDYSSLNRKTALMFKSLIEIFPNVQGCYKCDDDLILNMNSIFKIKMYIEYCKKFNTPIDYCGKICYLADNNDGIELYCGGPLYYLSNKSMACVKNVSQQDISQYTAEDRMVGSILHKNKIAPMNFDAYSDNIMDIDEYSFHNKHHKNTVFQRIHGGIGNQLFQIVSGYAIALKNNMNFVIINSSAIKRDFSHSADNNYLINTVFSKFPRINMNCINVDLIDYHKEKPEDCFQYKELKFTDDIFLDGYFQNEKYFSFCRTEILHKLKSRPEYYRFLEMQFGSDAEKYRKQLANSYFIHIRRGDYVNNPLYSINYDKYFSSAIAYILSIDPDAFFYVISDDIKYCKTYAVLNNIRKEFINLDDIETMHFMTYCGKGGICSNSSFSWWGSYLNENPDKIVTFPSKWTNNDWINDIWYEGSITINC